MTRPRAIRRFEALWLGAMLAWLAGLALSWGARRRMMAARPELAGYEWLVPAGFAAILVVALLLWWFAARRPYPVARVGVVAVSAIAAAMLVVSLGAIGLRGLLIPANLLQLVSVALGIGGAISLFGEGAGAWFGDADEVEA